MSVLEAGIEAAASGRRTVISLTAEERGIFQLTMHPHIIGVRSRIWILQDIVDRAKDLGAWFATHAQIVEYVKANSADRGRPPV